MNDEGERMGENEGPAVEGHDEAAVQQAEQAGQPVAADVPPVTPEPEPAIQPAPEAVPAEEDVPADIAAVAASLEAAEAPAESEPEAAAAEPAAPAEPEPAPATPATSESFDDIAPPAPEPAPAEQPAIAIPSRHRVSFWPFVVYVVAWAVLVGLAVWQFLQVPTGQAIYETQLYSITVLGGLLMTAAGPLLIVAVWLAAWLERDKGDRAGLLTSAMIMGASATLGGVLMWWIALVALDVMRLGRPL